MFFFKKMSIFLLILDCKFTLYIHWEVLIVVSFQDWGKEMLGDAYIIMPIAVIFSTFGAANGFCFSSAR